MITPLLLCLVPFLPPLLAQSSASPNLRKTPPLQGFFPGSTTPHPTGHVPTLEDIANDESFVNHDLLLAAARSPSNVGAMTYAVDFPQDNYQYILEMEAETTSRLWSLDDNYGHIHSFTDDGTHPGATVIVYPTAPFTFAVGDYIIGSHLGQWNDLVTVDHPFDYGITYSRKVTSVALVDGVRKLTTTAAHPQETLARSYMRMDLNFTEEKPMPARRLENDEDLKDWCKDACLSRSYYEKDGDLPAPMNVKVCDKCFDMMKTHLEFLRFNFDDVERKAKYPEINLGNGKGIVCRDCYAFVGTSINVELEYTPLYLRRFKVTYGGDIGFSYNLTIDDPTFPPFWEEQYERLEPDNADTQVDENGAPTEIKVQIHPNIRIPIGPPKPMPPPAPPLPCNDMSPIYTPNGLLNAIGIRLFDTCTVYLEIEGDFGINLMGLGSALGHTEYSMALVGSGHIGIQYTKFGPLENGHWSFWEFSGDWSPPKNGDFTDFRTNGLSVEMTFEPLIRFGLTGGTFPFNMLALVSHIQFEPYIGYEVFPGEHEGTFTASVFKASDPTSTVHEGGETLTVKIDYSDYTREDAVFLAIRNECWEEKEFMPLMSQRHTFDGSGSATLEWHIAYNDLFQVKHLDTGGFLCDWFDGAGGDYGGFLCTDWLQECNRKNWYIHPKLASQPFLDIAPTAPFEMWVNDLDDNRGIGITAPVNGTRAVAGEPFTFIWDHLGYTQYAGNAEISSAIPLNTVDVKLYYLYDCLFGAIGCQEYFLDLTDTTVGTPNDGSETLMMEECTPSGHKLSDASNFMTGASVYAVVQGRENTNVVSRVSGKFYVEPATTCTSSDFTVSFGNSYLKFATGFSNDVSIGVHNVKAWYDDDDERFTATRTVGPNGNFTFDEALPFKDVCTEDCMKIELTQEGFMGDSCVLWGGSIKMFMEAYREGEWEVLVVDVNNCAFINAPSGNGVNSTDAYGIPFIEFKWDRTITCPPGEFLKDNWWIVEKFLEKDQCEVCKANEFRAGYGEDCGICPLGTVAPSKVPAGHDSEQDCRLCSKGKKYTRDLDLSLSQEGADFYTPYFCETCPQDQYSDVEGSSECKDCPYGKAIRVSGDDGAQNHFSEKNCHTLCDGAHFFVDAGPYCHKKNRFGMCYGGFGYATESWCDDCNSCDDCSVCPDCAKCGRRLEMEETDFTEEELELIIALTSEEEVEEKIEEAEKLEEKLIRQPYVPPSDEHFKLSMIERHEMGTKKLTSSSASEQPVQGKFKLQPHQKVHFDKPSKRSRSLMTPVRILEGEGDDETCDTHYWGMGLSGGITHFRIVNPGGGLHKNLFQIDLYSNPDGQIDWDMLGPYVQDKHSYEFCGEMQPPTVPPLPTECEAGTFSIAGDTLSPCTVCPAGKYVATAGANSCVDCPQGTYNNDGKGVEKRFHDELKDCVAMVCPSGLFLDPTTAGTAQTAFSVRSCLLCAVGKYSNEVSDGGCTDCAVGTYSASQGMTACVDCTKGKYADTVGSSVCTDCGAGTYGYLLRANSTKVCVDCYAGSYSVNVGAVTVDTCTACAAGKASGEVGASAGTVCTDCAAGQSSMKSGSEKCDDCVAGSYSNAPGALQCTLCAYGKYGTAEKSVEASSCVDCTQGKYSGSMGATACEDCEAPLTVTDDFSECLEQFSFNESDIPADPYDYADGGGGGEGGGDAALYCPLHSEKTMVDNEEVCICKSTFTPSLNGNTGKVIACSCSEGKQVDSAGDACEDKPEASSHDQVKHECAVDCPEGFFENCDASFFQSPCKTDCDAQELYTYQQYFNKGCPENFQMPPVGTVEVNSRLELEDITKIQVTERYNDLLYFLTVLQYGVANAMSGVEWDNVIIRKIDGEAVESIVMGGDERRLDAGGVPKMQIDFSIIAPIANIADAQGKAVPDVSTAAALELSKAQITVITNAMFKELEVAVEEGDVISKGLEEVGGVEGDLGDALETADVKQGSLANPHVEIKAVGEFVEEEEAEEEDEGSGGGRFKLSEKQEFYLFCGGGGALAFALVGLMWKVGMKGEEEGGKKKKKSRKVPTDHKRPTAKGSVEMKAAAERESEGGEVGFEGVNPMAPGSRERKRDKAKRTIKKIGSNLTSLTAAPPPLPEDWDAVWDADQRCYYYYNHETGVTQWDVPTGV